MKKRFLLCFIAMLVFLAACGTVEPESAKPETTETESVPAASGGNQLYFESFKLFEEAILFGTQNGEKSQDEQQNEYLSIMNKWDGYYYPKIAEKLESDEVIAQPQYDFYVMPFYNRETGTDCYIAHLGIEESVEDYVRGMAVPNGMWGDIEVKDGYYYDRIGDETNPLSQMWWEQDGEVFKATFYKTWSWEQIMAFCDVEWVKVERG